MTVTVASFRAAFPAFANATIFPSPEVQFWLDLAGKLHNAERWDDLLDFGEQLFMAHNLALEAQSEQAARAGQIPGQVVGPVSSAQVDKVSYSRDVGRVLDPTAGHWNLTIYGMRYIRLLRNIGAGAHFISGGCDPTGFGGAGGAAFGWPGPPIYPPY